MWDCGYVGGCLGVCCVHENTWSGWIDLKLDALVVLETLSKTVEILGSEGQWHRVNISKF